MRLKDSTEKTEKRFVKERDAAKGEVKIYGSSEFIARTPPAPTHLHGPQLHGDFW